MPIVWPFLLWLLLFLIRQSSVSFQNDDLGTGEVQLQRSVGFLGGRYAAICADDADDAGGGAL